MSHWMRGRLKLELSAVSRKQKPTRDYIRIENRAI